jgi:hypothetical protein
METKWLKCHKCKTRTVYFRETIDHYNYEEDRVYSLMRDWTCTDCDYYRAELVIDNDEYRIVLNP